MAPILFAGDPHRNFTPILRACLGRPAGALIIVGDCDCPAPLPVVTAPLLTAGWTVHWILGNHDTDTETGYNHLVGGHPEGDLGLRVTEIGGLLVAGLPGVFKPRIWLPRAEPPAPDPDPPRYLTRAAFLAALPPGSAWRGGLPLWHRDTIFPEDFDRLAALRFDVLVTHEAPSSHPYGFAVIDALAERAGASIIVHGHHHDSYEGKTAGGVRVRGLGLSEVYELER
jgi:hypothetical protein